MTHIEIVRWRDLDPAARSRWHALRRLRAEYESPYFDPRFLDAVDRARGDLFIAGLDGAYLPFHEDRLGGLLPAGGPLSDCHGFIGSGPVDARPLLERAGAHALLLPSTPALRGRFEADATAFHLIDLSRGVQPYLDDLAHRAAKPLRNLRARRRRALEAFGEIRFEADARDEGLLALLMRWKSGQYRRTGQFDVFSRAWTRRVVRRLAETREADFQGRLSALWFGDQPAAVHFGMQSAGVLHYWFPAYDERLAAFSPGLLLLQELIANAEAIGVRRIDLGQGDYRFKSDFANDAFHLVPQKVFRSTLTGRARAAMDWLCEPHHVSRGAQVANLVGRASRRLYRSWTFHAVPGPAPLTE